MCFSIARFYKKVSETAVLTHTRKFSKSHHNLINRKEESLKTRETHGVEQGEVNFQKRLNYLIEKRKFKFNR